MTPALKSPADAVLNLWAEGLPAALIAERLGLPRSLVYNIARAARSEGDPRALTRQANRA